MTKMLVANWKMSLMPDEESALAREIVSSHSVSAVEIVLCPSFLSLSSIKDITQNTKIKLGAQNCASAEKGAYTGEVSPASLKELGCEYVILGHSERRTIHGESSNLIKQKAEAAHVAGLKTIICIGETHEQFTRNKTAEILTNQLQESVPSSSTYLNTVIAYEPVWAIGTGKLPNRQEVESATSAIMKAGFVKPFKILYGGSVSPENTSELLSLKGIAGLLVGGASLNCTTFKHIITILEQTPCTQY